jgi:hypothetical protein
MSGSEYFDELSLKSNTIRSLRRPRQIIMEAVYAIGVEAK